MKMFEVAVNSLYATKDNPRKFREDQAFKDLVASVKEVGILQPILARPVEGTNEQPPYEIRAGERRWRAAIAAKIDVVPVILREMTDAEAMEVTVTENLHREDLTPLEEGAGVATLMRSGMPADQVAEKLGKTITWVYRRARLADLSKKWRAMAEDPDCMVSSWPANYLELIARFPHDVQDDLIVTMGWRLRESDLGLKELQRFTGEQLHLLRLAPFDQEDPLLHPKAGACPTCPKQSMTQPHLFEDDPEDYAKMGRDNKCLDAGCWGLKVKYTMQNREKELRAEHKDLVLVAGDGTEYDPDRDKSIFSHHSVDAAKKSDPKAIPALIVSGKGQGQLRWVKIDRATMPSRGQRPRWEDGKPKPKSLAVRKEEMRARRMKWARVEISEQIEKSCSPPDGDVAIITAACGFGTEDRKTNGYHGDPIKGMADCFEAAPDHLGQLWKEVRQNVAAWIQHDQVENDHAMEALRRLGWEGELIRLTKLAETEIPDPKSWAAEEEKKASRRPKVKSKSAAEK